MLIGATRAAWIALLIWFGIGLAIFFYTLIPFAATTAGEQASLSPDERVNVATAPGIIMLSLYSIVTSGAIGSIAAVGLLAHKRGRAVFWVFPSTTVAEDMEQQAHELKAVVQRKN